MQSSRRSGTVVAPLCVRLEAQCWAWVEIPGRCYVDGSLPTRRICGVGEEIEQRLERCRLGADF